VVVARSYYGYGLLIQSPLEFPELVAASTSRKSPSAREPDVTIIEKAFDDPALPEGTVQDSDIRIFLLGSCLGTVLMQRGCFVLHASVAARGNSAVAVTGDSGVGKSTSLGILLAQGWQLVSDDLCAITWDNETPLVIPAYPQLKLNHDSVCHLSLAEKDLVWINRFKSKKAYRVPNEFYKSPIPLHSILVNTLFCIGMPIGKFSTSPWVSIELFYNMLPSLRTTAS